MNDRNRFVEYLGSAISVASVTLAIASVTSSLTLPKLRPITIALVVFFVILGLAAVAQVILSWKALKNPEERQAFVHTLVYGLFLFVLMVGGMFARYFWELFQIGKGWDEAELKPLLLPLLVSLMVFYPLWTIASGAPRNFFSIVAAFQNGFFWQTIFSGLRPFTGQPGG